MDDVWKIVKLLKGEVMQLNDKGKNKDLPYSIYQQLPFFTCPNNFLDLQAQSDISRYVAATDLKIPAYPGSYGSYPSKYITKVHTIKETLSKKSEIMSKKKGK